MSAAQVNALAASALSRFHDDGCVITMVADAWKAAGRPLDGRLARNDGFVAAAGRSTDRRRSPRPGEVGRVDWIVPTSVENRQRIGRPTDVVPGRLAAAVRAAVSGTMTTHA